MHKIFCDQTSQSCNHQNIFFNFCFLCTVKLLQSRSSLCLGADAMLPGGDGMLLHVLCSVVSERSTISGISVPIWHMWLYLSTNKYHIRRLLLRNTTSSELFHLSVVTSENLRLGRFSDNFFFFFFFVQLHGVNSIVEITWQLNHFTVITLYQKPLISYYHFCK